MTDVSKLKKVFLITASMYEVGIEIGNLGKVTHIQVLRGLSKSGKKPIEMVVVNCEHGEIEIPGHAVLLLVFENMEKADAD